MRNKTRVEEKEKYNKQEEST